jgi:hypothetical protein
VTIWTLLAPLALAILGPAAPPNYPITLPAVIADHTHPAPAPVLHFRTAPATWAE